MKIKLRILSMLFMVTASQGKCLEGSWRGELVMSPAVLEADVSVELRITEQGETTGRLNFPISGPAWYAIENFAMKGSEVSFSVRDESGVTSSFRGQVSSDGNKIAGEMLEGKSSFVFTLEREVLGARKDNAPTLRKLSPGGEELKSAFNSDTDRRRLLVILSPSSFASKVMLSLIERYVLDRNADPDLRLYVLWETSSQAFDSAIEGAIQPAANLARDGRVLQFWTLDRRIGDLFRSNLNEIGKDAGTFPCFVFSRGKHWSEAPPPSDLVRLVSSRGPKAVPESDRFNAADLARDVEMLLVAQSVVEK